MRLFVITLSVTILIVTLVIITLSSVEASLLLEGDTSNPLPELLPNVTQEQPVTLSL